MAAPTDANGTEKYWYDGLPLEAVVPTGDEEELGTMKYWADGLPVVVAYPASGAPATTVKDIIGMGFIPFAR